MTSQYDAAPAGEDPIAAQLMSQAQTIARLRKDLDDLAHQSTDTFVGLVERIEGIESGAGSEPAPRRGHDARFLNVHDCSDPACVPSLLRAGRPGPKTSTPVAAMVAAMMSVRRTCAWLPGSRGRCSSGWARSGPGHGDQLPVAVREA